MNRSRRRTRLASGGGKLILKSSLGGIVTLAIRAFTTKRYLFGYLDEKIFYGAGVQSSAGQIGPQQNRLHFTGILQMINPRV